MGLSQQVRVMFGYQTNDIVKHPVLLVHGDGKVRLLHCSKQPACVKGERGLFKTLQV